MIDMAEIDGIEDWLIDQALGSPDMATMFAEMCERLRRCHVPVDRAMIGWSVLHPLIDAEAAIWENGNALQHQQIAHAQEDTEDWLKSPIRSVLVNREPVMRRRLTNANAPSEFPLLESLSAAGYSDYVVIMTEFDIPTIRDEISTSGIVVSWATKEENGFSDEALTAIRYIQRRLALAARATLEAQISRTIAETYLGKIAGNKVLHGQIRHGDGENIDAVVYFSDMRNSTAIAEKLGPDAYLSWLNTYFEATAGAILGNGGEVLDFIGDAVLGVFPTGGQSLETSVAQAIAAADETRKRLTAINADPGLPQPLKAGIALSVGSVMFGNIGVPNRMTFSVIGQTVHAAARIESLTKSVGVDVLMTDDIARFAGARSRPVGAFSLDGFAEHQPLFALE
ncbi:adenylate/guanylate cyclase domain-containing protein [Roseibium salinum]|uniref:Adenylate/guanylate cyclase domain-containing protein n=1 Tax=Roseibium salinum TaxID=1604349 RepID=A0ABT3R875_9HYPH|nr:adenylate/guanylate cyclase domain-containing protein [Roseibium sp. DSM 29163]MCX2725198.1 adenylate/guanylate cyclase domain-containing protein [Roseibium sp. DSM 29163]